MKQEIHVETDQQVNRESPPPRCHLQRLQGSLGVLRQHRRRRTGLHPAVQRHVQPGPSPGVASLLLDPTVWVSVHLRRGPDFDVCSGWRSQHRFFGRLKQKQQQQEWLILRSRCGYRGRSWHRRPLVQLAWPGDVVPQARASTGRRAAGDPALSEGSGNTGP